MANDYGTILEGWKDTYPTIYRLLDRRRFIKGITIGLLTEQFSDYVRAFEEFLVFLSEVEELYMAFAKTEPIAFLVARIAEDFEVAFDVLASGHYYLLTDRMRDVLEVDLLVKDFLLDSTRIQVWLHSDPRTIRNDYSPRAIRARLAKAQRIEVGQLAGTSDYSIHSQLLHLGPMQYHHPSIPAPGTFRTIRGQQALSWIIVCLHEVFYHAGAIMDSLLALYHRLSHHSIKDVKIAADLEHFVAVYAKTLKVVRGEDGPLGGTSTASNHNDPSDDADN